MAVYTLPEAMKRSRNRVMQGLAKAIVTTDEMANVLPIVPVDGTAIEFLREGTEPSTEFISDAGTTTEESTGTDDLVRIPIRRIVGNSDLDALALDLTGDPAGSQKGTQVAKKVKATWRKAMDKFVNGSRVTSHTLGSSADPFLAVDAIDYGPWLDSDRYGPGSLKYTHAGTLWQFRAPGDVDYGTAVACASDGSYTLYSHNKNKYITVTLDVSDATGNGETHIRFASSNNEYDGLLELCVPDQVIAPTGANGDAFSLQMLDELISKEKVRTNRVFVANSKILEKYFSAQRSLGGINPGSIVLPGYAQPVPTYRGIPFLINDNIKSNETVGGASTCSSIYLASLDANEGLFFGVANTGGAQGLNVDADPRAQVVLGFRIQDMGPLEGKDADRVRVKLYGATALKSTLALARRRGITTA